MTSPRLVVDLADPACCDPSLSGAKAANIARAAVAGLPTLPGFALTTASFDADDPGWDRGLPSEVEAALRAAWEPVSAGGRRALVVRSSSTVEDIGESSMAGQFTSVLDVVGWDAFLGAVRTVGQSATSPTPGDVLPMAVLVQRQLDVTCGGVAFGIDPVSGDAHHYVIEAVAGGPDQLVSGTVTAQRYLVTHRGRTVESDLDDEPVIDARVRRRVARLVHRAGRVFGRAQDIEWAVDRDGALWLLQSRPVTATGATAGASGPVLGPGPIGETFPDPLRRLEVELWVEPLREGISRALVLSGAVSRRRLGHSPVVAVVGGRVAADLDLFGYTPTKRSGWRLLDPRPGARRLRAAWRIGQLRNVLGERVADVVMRCDADLGAVPSLAQLDSAQLLGLLERCRDHLIAVHGHEVLAGTLLPADDDAPSAAAVALESLARGRADGLDDGTIVARSPVVLALVPPRVGKERELPDHTETASYWRRRWRPDRITGTGDLGARDALRLRARWLHELSGRAAWLVGERASEAGALASPDDVVHLDLVELDRLVREGAVPVDLEARLGQSPGAPLPAAFRLGPDGRVAPVRRRGDHRGGGRGAGGGRGEGVVTHGTPTVGEGEVLVVRTLSPRLAASLPRAAGLIAETGSVLSHLAILAREYGVPTVVGVHDALHRYPVGARVLVDGDTGEITVVDAGGGSDAATTTATTTTAPTATGSATSKGEPWAS